MSQDSLEYVEIEMDFTIVDWIKTLISYWSY